MIWLAFLGCGKKDDGDHSGDPVAGCAALQSAPLSSVSANEWPPDLGPTLASYDGLAGRWTAQSDCGQGAVGVKLVPLPRDTLEVVTAPYPASAPCGCIVDPEFGPDGAYGQLATFDGLQVYVETWDDPGVSGRNLVAAGGLFDAASPFQVRACARDNIDPYLQSAWDNVNVVVRQAGGDLEMAIELTNDDGTSDVCHLTGFSFVEGL